MLEDNELMSVRLAKLGRLRDRGIDPYPHRFKRTHTGAEATALFESAETQSDDSEARSEPVSVAGRIVALRGMGRATFADLLDGTGRIQVMFRRNVLEEDYGILQDLDLGDWVGVSGQVFRTRMGEVTVEAGSLRVLCKSLRPLPEKWHGLVDVEARYRQRYLDLIANEEARHTATLRPRIVSAIRRFMDARGFLEVETPVLVPVAAGAMAHPFVTHHNALNRDLFLRIATELYLKRLIVGGHGEGLRDRKSVPQRGRRPGPQPGVHHDGELRVVRGLQRRNGDGGGAGFRSGEGGDRERRSRVRW